MQEAIKSALDRAWIIQIGKNQLPPWGLFDLNSWWAYTGQGTAIQLLYDRSGGKGVLPEEWPEPGHHSFGYAGGLSPENIKDQLFTMAAACGDREIWIDMEGRIRDDNDNFCLNKVRQVIKIVQESGFLKGG